MHPFDPNILALLAEAHGADIRLAIVAHSHPVGAGPPDDGGSFVLRLFRAARYALTAL